MKPRRKYTPQFKLSLLRELETGKQLAQLCRENELHPSLVTRWKKEYQDHPKTAFQGNGNTYKTEARISELEKLVGQLYAENALLKKVTSRLELSLQEQRRRISSR